MAEFFILAKFQGKGIGQNIAGQIWDLVPGKWEVSVIPENRAALSFWQKTIADYTAGHYQQEIKTIDYDEHQPKRIIFTLKTPKGS